MRLYDGDGVSAGLNGFSQAGVTGRFYNRAARIRWQHPGGDWVDAAGVDQGPKPFASARLKATAGHEVALDMTPLMSAEGVVLRTSGAAAVSFASRESVAPPVLHVLREDGSELHLQPTADASLDISTAKSMGKADVLIPNPVVVLQFPRVQGKVSSATLYLRVVKGGGEGELRAYAMRVPRLDPGAVSGGYASRYPLDLGIEKDPRTLYAESWDQPRGWQEKTGWHYGSARSPWELQDGVFPLPMFKGMWLADGSGDVPAQCTSRRVSRGTGFVGNGLMGVHCPDVLAQGVQVPTFNLIARGGEREEAWARYYIKYGASHLHFAKCEGGKAPGLAGDTSVAGNSGRPGWGIRGWSMRHQFQFVCDPDNPAYDRIVFGVYAYDGDRFDDMFGGTWTGQDLSLLQTDRWYCIEQRVKVNTPGLNDGIVQLYIDGRLVVDKTDVLLRSVRPPEGYGHWELIPPGKMPPPGKPLHIDHRGKAFWLKGRTLDGNLGIAKFWGMVHGGGRTPTGVSGQFWYDQTVVATERIGCIAGAAK